MIFPRRVVEVGKCIAVVALKTQKRTVKGKPILHARSKIKFKGRQWIGGRLSFYFNHFKIPSTPKPNKGFICHTCDNAWCVNPDHLYLGTSSSNINDTYDRHPTFKINQAKSKIGNQNRLGIPHSEKTKKQIGRTLRRLRKEGILDGKGRRIATVVS
jgi:hypothetical protein